MYAIGRTTLLAAALLANCLTTFSRAANIDWDDGGLTKNWSNPFNWNPTGSPLGDDLEIGNLAAAQDDMTIIDQDFDIDSLILSNGADADTDGNFLDVAGDITIGGSGTSFFAREHNSGASTTAVDAFNITVNAGGSYRTSGGRTIVAVPGAGAASSGVVDINAAGVFSGWGTLRFQDGLDGVDTIQFVNDGLLATARDGGAPSSQRFTLLIESTDGGADDARVDLDGANNGVIVIIEQTTLDIDMRINDVVNTEMTLFAGAIFDSEQIWIHRGTMEVNASTTSAGVDSAATIAGALATFQSGAQTNLNAGTLILDADATFNSGSTLSLASGSALQVNGETTIHGDIDIGNSPDVSFHVNDSLTINDAVWNWDGNGTSNNLTAVNSGATLTINSDDIETSGDGNFGGILQINGGEVDADITGGWVMNRLIRFDLDQGAGVLEGTELTVDGGTIRSTGFHVSGARIEAPVVFTSGPSTRTQAVGDSRIRLDGGVTFQGGSTHDGTGELSFDDDVTVNGPLTINMPSGQVDLDGSGETNSHDWHLNSDLTINAESVGVGNIVGGTSFAGQNAININNSNTTLNINLTDSADEWTLGGDGTINITAPGTLNTSLAGSDLNVEGDINITGDTRFSARIDVESGGNINVIGTTSSLQLLGGSAADPNTISGSFILGDGDLLASGTSLVGNGQINTDVNFTSGADLIAEGGLLVVNGAITNADRLVSSGSSAILLLNSNLNTANITALEVAGGRVTGTPITNNGLTEGNGSIESTGFINNGTLRATGGAGKTLTIAGGATPIDLDGAGITGVLEATDGNLRIDRTLTDHFGGDATVGTGFTLTFDQGWTLGTNGTLNLNGSATIVARLTGNGSQLDGVVNVTNRAAINGDTTVGNTATVDLSSTNDRLSFTAGDMTIEDGATFTGDGLLSATSSGNLILENGAKVGVSVENDRRLHLGDDSDAIAKATVKTLDQTALGVLFIDIAGSSQFDLLELQDQSTIDGTLDVDLVGGFMPSLGDEFAIISGGALLGTFATQPGDLPTPGSGLNWQIDYTGSGVTLRVVNANFFGDANVDGTVNNDDIPDFVTALLNLGDWQTLHPGLDPLVYLDGDMNSMVNNDDIPSFVDALLNPPFLTSSASAVPEPSSIALLFLAAAAYSAGIHRGHVGSRSSCAKSARL